MCCDEEKALLLLDEESANKRQKMSSLENTRVFIRQKIDKVPKRNSRVRS